MKDLVAHIFWTDEDGERRRFDVSGESYIDNTLARMDWNNPIEEIKKGLVVLLQEQAENGPVVLTPDAMRTLAELMDPYKMLKTGPKVKTAHLPDIAQAWGSCFAREYIQAKRKGLSTQGLRARIDDAFRNSGVGKERLKQAKAKYRKIIDSHKARAKAEVAALTP